MSVIEVQESEVPAGDYEGAFVDVAKKDFGHGPKYQWQFRVTSGEYEGKTLSGFTGIEPTTANKLGRFLAWLAGQNAPSAGLSVDPSDYIGRTYTLHYAVPRGGSKPSIQQLKMLGDSPF